MTGANNPMNGTACRRPLGESFGWVEVESGQHKAGRTIVIGRYSIGLGSILEALSGSAAAVKPLDEFVRDGSMS